MDPNDRSVYLTFDDGPIPQSTPFILKTLEDFGIKATFFMVGDNYMSRLLRQAIRWAITLTIISGLSSTGLLLTP